MYVIFFPFCLDGVETVCDGCMIQMLGCVLLLPRDTVKVIYVVGKQTLRPAILDATSFPL